MKHTRLEIALAATVAATVAAGCATTGGPSPFRPEPGTTVEVAKRLEFSSKSTRLYIQSGKRVHRNDVQRLFASCSIGRDRTGESGSVEPGTFTTGETTLSIRVSDAAPRKPVRVAFNTAAGSSSSLQVTQPDAGPSIHMYDTVIPLRSEEQPRVTDLVCSYDGGPRGGHLTRAEIENALGDLVRFY